MTITKEQLKWYGRYLDVNNIRYFNYSNAGFEFCFTGKKAILNLVSDSDDWQEENQAVLALYVKEIDSTKQYSQISFWENLEDEPRKKIFLSKPQNQIVLWESLEEKTVVIKVLKISEVVFGYAGFSSLQIEGFLVEPFKTEKKDNPLNIEFIGDSITCGYGVEGKNLVDTFTTKQERSDNSFAFYTAKQLNANFSCVSWSGIGLISKYIDESINLPDTTITMPLLWHYTDKELNRRLKLEPEIWDEAKFSPDLVIVNLGTNDNSFVRKMECRRMSYVHELRCFIEAIHRRSPKAKICCCLGVMGQDLCDSVFEAVDLFSKDFCNVKIKAVKLPLQDELNDGAGCDWHPTKKTHQKTADFLVSELKEMLTPK